MEDGLCQKPCPGSDLKPRPNRKRYLQVLRSMTPEQRLAKAFELSAMTKELFLAGLKRKLPDATPAELRAKMLKRLERCHNRNY